MKGNPPAEWSLVYNSDHAANYQVTDGHGAPVPEVERFLHRVGLRGLAPGSLRTYAHDLLCAFRWLATEALAPSAIGAEALLRFVDYQRSRLGAAPATINRRRSRILQANPHRFRHTFAANMAKNGVTLPILMKMLGHSDPTVTLRYVCLNDQEVRHQYERALRLLGGKKTAP